MEGTVANFEALAEMTVFLSFFKDLPDRRQPGKVFICFENDSTRIGLFGLIFTTRRLPQCRMKLLL
jgi:hypothetical protein